MDQFNINVQLVIRLDTVADQGEGPGPPAYFFRK